MSGFDVLQGRFVGTELSAFGLPGQGAEIFQPPVVIPNDDAALWGLFNAIPQAGSVYEPTGSVFFTAYAAVIGALIAGTSPLDPVAAAKRRLADWGTAPPTWTIGYAGMSSLLSAAPDLTFDFDAPAAPEPGFWGLLGDPPPQERGPSTMFASGAVQARVTFAHLLTFAPQPGDWYVSSALSLAYASPGTAPWDPSSPITWDTTFGPNGSLQRMLSALIVASGLAVTATSSASFDRAQQKQVDAGVKARGIWPYYLLSTAASTDVAFDGDGRISLTIRSKPKTAVAVAAVVQSASRYLGA